jgi:hypothetical protein
VKTFQQNKSAEGDYDGKHGMNTCAKLAFGEWSPSSDGYKWMVSPTGYVVPKKVYLY